MIPARDQSYEIALLEKRIAYVQKLKRLLQDQDSVVAVSVRELTALVDELVHSVAKSVVKEVQRGEDTLRVIQPTALALPPATAPLSKHSVDVFGRAVLAVALDQVGCPNCNRTIAAGRLAPHLEKCMGRGRAASRAAQERMSTLDLW